MKIIAGGLTLQKLIDDFARRFPRLTTKGGSFGKCKFMSYELSLYLRRRGIKAKLIHVQHVKSAEFRKTAHSAWVEKKPSDWSHYVVQVGAQYIDLTARQFDSNLEFPRYSTKSQLAAEWEIVEADSFLNKLIGEVLQSQMDANRSMRQGAIKKTDIGPRVQGKPQAQQLRPAPA